jgi:hypothetical protein
MLNRANILRLQAGKFLDTLIYGIKRAPVIQVPAPKLASTVSPLSPSLWHLSFIGSLFTVFSLDMATASAPTTHKLTVNTTLPHERRLPLICISPLKDLMDKPKNCDLFRLSPDEALSPVRCPLTPEQCLLIDRWSEEKSTHCSKSAEVATTALARLTQTRSTCPKWARPTAERPVAESPTTEPELCLDSLVRFTPAIPISESVPRAEKISAPPRSLSPGTPRPYRPILPLLDTSVLSLFNECSNRGAAPNTLAKRERTPAVPWSVPCVFPDPGEALGTLDSAHALCPSWCASELPWLPSQLELPTRNCLQTARGHVPSGLWNFPSPVPVKRPPALLSPKVFEPRPQDDTSNNLPYVDSPIPSLARRPIQRPTHSLTHSPADLRSSQPLAPPPPSADLPPAAPNRKSTRNRPPPIDLSHASYKGLNEIDLPTVRPSSPSIQHLLAKTPVTTINLGTFDQPRTLEALGSPESDISSFGSPYGSSQATTPSNYSPTTPLDPSPSPVYEFKAEEGACTPIDCFCDSPFDESARSPVFLDPEYLLTGKFQAVAQVIADAVAADDKAISAIEMLPPPAYDLRVPKHLRQKGSEMDLRSQGMTSAPLVWPHSA